MQQWGAERIGELAALVAAAAPDEDLTTDELLTALYDQPGVVLGRDAAEVVAAGVGRDGSGVLVATVRLIAVHPDHRTEGRGAELLAAAEAWAGERGAARIEIGGLLPFPLWPGATPDAALVHIASARGFVRGPELRAIAVPTSFRATPPPGVVIRRVVHDDDVTAVVLAVSARWPRCSDEVARALDHGTCHGAFATSPTDPDGRHGDLIGLGCHSVTRASWVGPLVVGDDDRRRGIGHALLAQICRDLMIAEFPTAEVPGLGDAGPEAFAVAAGGTLARTHVVLAKSLVG